MDIYCTVAILTGIIAGFAIGASHLVIDILLPEKQFDPWVKIVVGFVITFLAMEMTPSYTWVTVAALAVTCVATIITTSLIECALMKKKFQFSGPLNIKRGEKTETVDTNIIFTISNN